MIMFESSTELRDKRVPFRLKRVVYSSWLITLAGWYVGRFDTKNQEVVDSKPCAISFINYVNVSHSPHALWSWATRLQSHHDSWLHSQISYHSIDEDVFTIEEFLYFHTDLTWLNVSILLKRQSFLNIYLVRFIPWYLSYILIESVVEDSSSQNHVVTALCFARIFELFLTF